MDTLHPSFDREHLVLVKARKALNQEGECHMAPAYGELMGEYEMLLERLKRVTELTLTVQMDLDAAIEQIDQLSQVDGLTGVANRRTFERILARDWAQAQREASPISLIIVDVDSFRAYNQIYSSLDGDDCLKSVAQALMRCLYREVDLAGRMEGDTFAALLPGTEEQGASLVAMRMMQEVQALEIPHLESPHGGMVTVSLGVATMTPGRSDTPMMLIRQAQSALGQAKAQGRATMVCAPDGQLC